MPGKAFHVLALHAPLSQVEHGPVTCPPGCPWFPLWCGGSWAQAKATFLGPVPRVQLLFQQLTQTRK